jgi:hypothetical protein
MNVRLDRLLGRRVIGTDNRTIGRLEEFRAERRGDKWFVTEYVIGPAGFLERLGLGTHLVLGWRRRGFVARWDQVDITNPDRLQLLCSLVELRPIRI